MIRNAIQTAYNNGMQAGFMWGFAFGIFLALMVKAAKIVMKDQVKKEL